MDLKTFVRAALHEVADVMRAEDPELKAKGVTVGMDLSKWAFSPRHARFMQSHMGDTWIIDFDIAIARTEDREVTGGGKASPFGVGASLQVANNEHKGNTQRIQFSVPLSFQKDYRPGSAESGEGS
ncbi:MAG: hypothetical protein AAGJ10_20575 [Bacteroidota bacterium]